MKKTRPLGATCIDQPLGRPVELVSEVVGWLEEEETVKSLDDVGLIAAVVESAVLLVVNIWRPLLGLRPRVVVVGVPLSLPALFGLDDDCN